MSFSSVAYHQGEVCSLCIAPIYEIHNQIKCFNVILLEVYGVHVFACFLLNVCCLTGSVCIIAAIIPRSAQSNTSGSWDVDHSYHSPSIAISRFR